MDKKTLISVTNRNDCIVGYPVPDNTAGLERMFAPGETKEIEFEEIEKLSWTKGGKILLEEYLVLNNDEAISTILGDVEPEYYYSKEDIEKLLISGSVEEVMDCLDFGTTGVIEILKNLAVDLEIPDTRKRQAITEKTGLNIDTAIALKHMEEDEDKVVEEPKTRRVATISEAPQRRATVPTTSKYSKK